MKNKGFTLVELLVVIGIIALVMVAVFPNFTGARERARDNQRKSDIKNIQSAVELYKSDQNPPVYPPALGASFCGQCWTSAGSAAVCPTGSVNIYMRKFPCDPQGVTTPTPFIYTRNSDNLKYTISACLENPVDQDRDPEAQKVAACKNASYTVNEP